MIGLDTNVIVRYVAQDDAVQSAVATRLIESFSSDDPGFVPLICLVEMIWVLRTHYKAKFPDIARVLETLLRSEGLIVERADLAWQALRQFARTKGDFADCLIERCANAGGCDYTATFDREAVSIGMKLLS